MSGMETCYPYIIFFKYLECHCPEVQDGETLTSGNKQMTVIVSAESFYRICVYGIQSVRPEYFDFVTVKHVEPVVCPDP